MRELTHLAYVKDVLDAALHLHISHCVQPTAHAASTALVPPDFRKAAWRPVEQKTYCKAGPGMGASDTKHGMLRTWSN